MQCQGRPACPGEGEAVGSTLPQPVCDPGGGGQQGHRAPVSSMGQSLAFRLSLEPKGTQ